MSLSDDEKKLLVLGEGFSMKPTQETHVRVAKVLTVSLLSRDMIVQYIDGDHSGSVPLEDSVTVSLIVGSADPATTYIPSATVYGRGDIVNILIHNGNRYAISPGDMHTHLNRENYALVAGWALHDVLNGLLVDISDDLADSYLDFYNPLTMITTRIEGDPDKRHVMRRLLDYFKVQGQNIMDTALVNDTYEYEKLNGGPSTASQHKFFDRTHRGKGVNGFNYVEDVLFGSADLTANLTAYHSTLTDLTTASMHPDIGPTLEVYFESACVVWFDEDEDEDPEYVLVIATFPAWDTTSYIKFLEVPVHSLAGRKFLERDDDDKIVLSWALYADQVRELHTIERTYVNWTVHGLSAADSERVARALPVYATKPVNGVCTFGLIDGHGFDQGNIIYEPVKLKKIEGGIVRSDSLSEASNGSMFNYEITHNNPVSTGTLDQSYSTYVHFFDDDAGTEYADFYCNNPDKEYPMFTDGTNTMHKRVDYNYHVDGKYTMSYVENTPIWNNGLDGFIADATGILNEAWQKIYYNGVLLFTDHFRFSKVSDWIYADMTFTFFHAADIDYGLFVCERVIVDLDGEDGPSYACTGTIKRQGLVIFEGVEYLIWELTKDVTTFPTLWNFFPWQLDALFPERPTTPPYDFTNADYVGVFWWVPFYDYSMTPLSGYEPRAWSYPGSGDSCHSKLFISIRDEDNPMMPSDAVQMSVDRDTDSFAVRFPCFLSTALPSITLLYPSIGDTLYRFNGGTPHFNAPVADNVIKL